MEHTDRLFRILEETREKVSKLEEWQRSSDTNRELRALAEERQRREKGDSR